MLHPHHEQCMEKPEKKKYYLEMPILSVYLSSSKITMSLHHNEKLLLRIVYVCGVYLSVNFM